MTKADLWNRFQEYLCICESIELSLDISRMSFDDAFFKSMASPMAAAFKDMSALEKGAMANPDEKRMVGHYWLRAPNIAPDVAIKTAIEQTVGRIKAFAADVHSGKIKPEKSPRFTRVLSIGIGGSALGPMFVSDALGNPSSDKLQIHFIDNTDPDGCARILQTIGSELSQTLTLVISKSGSTPESRNGMLLAAAAYKAAGLEFARHAVAITGDGSHLDRQAQEERWLSRFPMWDWVGGRTSELSAVGLLPAALQGIDIDAMLAGAAACDEVTRRTDVLANPAALLALMWYHATGGRGEKDMVMLPYKDRLLLFSRYLQQLVMESLGKRINLKGERVDQGIAVYGNKGSTDQHAYVQQLRDGVNNFFVTFIRVLEDGGESGTVESNITVGDYLHGFLLGTREALSGNDRQSMMLTVRRIDARTIGVLIALFERTVGLYASLIGINAYHQPGVEAGKKAATAVLALQSKILSSLSQQPQTAAQLAATIGHKDDAETLFSLLEHLAANGRAKQATDGGPAVSTFCAMG
ncbi:MAG: glucose-6-phosphate isomerase [Planctomycetes bacterium]|nr:glucose-6-phosphate isomerase [Planctomycetota bacterium]